MNARAPLPLDRFAPVALDELVDEAALMHRVDRKYLVPRPVAVGLLAGLGAQSGAAVRVLEIGGSREFAYDSVYFDTADRLSYRLTAQRRRRRFKLRTRTYVDSGTAYLELKTKSGRGSTVKQRIAYDPADRSRLTPEGRAYLREALSEHGHDPSLADELGPALTSRYRRATLLLPDGSRATFDTELFWAGRDGRGIDLHGHAIIESKSPDRPNRLDRALWRAGHRPSGISKFGTGTAALRPELPGNKWARALAGPFAEARPVLRPEAAAGRGPGAVRGLARAETGRPL